MKYAVMLSLLLAPVAQADEIIRWMVAPRDNAACDPFPNIGLSELVNMLSEHRGSKVRAEPVSPGVYYLKNEDGSGTVVASSIEACKETAVHVRKAVNRTGAKALE